MYFSYFLSNLFVPILAIQLMLICSVLSLNLTNTYLHHICNVKEGTYKHGSIYEVNLKNVTRVLLKEPLDDGFTSLSRPDPPNSVSLKIQCRGDSYGSNCRSCAATAVTGFHNRCKGNKGGIIWYDQCLFEVTTIYDPITPERLNFENTFSMYNPNNIKGDTKLFSKKMRKFLENLILKAGKLSADGMTFLNYAAGELNFGNKKLYAMVQCVQDVVDCKDCLEWSMKHLTKCCDSKQGARVISEDCNIRYELYPFLRS